LMYWNAHTKKVVQLNGIYRDLHMSLNKKGQKRDILIANPDVRKKTIAEMKSRMKALIITIRMGLYYHSPAYKKSKTFWGSLQQAMDLALLSRSFWESVDSSLSLLDIVCLEYAATTGEMKNYEPVAAHQDGNSSHYLESMTIFAKLPMPRQGQSCTSLVSQMVPGILAVPMHGFAFKITCGRDVLHSRLTGTVHVADYTRNDRNFSWVHGP